MPRHTAYVGIGSNLEGPVQQVLKSFLALHNLAATQCVALSGLYASRAVGPGDQPDYVNAAAKLLTDLEPHALLDALQAIECQQRRTREVRWGARTLDLDLLLFDDRTINDTRLTVPHPRLVDRNFVLAPLLDIAPELTLPDGSRAADHLQRCQQRGIERLRPNADSAQ